MESSNLLVVSFTKSKYIFSSMLDNISSKNEFMSKEVALFFAMQFHHHLQPNIPHHLTSNKSATELVTTLRESSLLVNEKSNDSVTMSLYKIPSSATISFSE